jgi:hypothetical protein
VESKKNYAFQKEYKYFLSVEGRGEAKQKEGWCPPPPPSEKKEQKQKEPAN